MNLPNKLTIGRILLIPIIMIVYSIEPLRNMAVFDGFYHLSWCNLIILLLTAIGALTDLIDGKIARKHNLVTDLGKFLDPLADKLLVTTLLIIILDQCSYYQFAYRYSNVGQPKLSSLLEWWMVVIILAREFIVTGIRMLAATKKKVIAASYFGKVKTTVQFITILFLLLGCAVVKKATGELVPYDAWYVIISKIFVFATLILTIFSGADYLLKNLDLLVDKSAKKAKTK